ncbi:MAG: HEAT repeat domain-containing protein, partial [Phycisphaerae bacterium]
YRFDDALRKFSTHVDPLLERVGPRIASAIADNKTVIQMANLQLSAQDDFYHLVDQRRILGVELFGDAARTEAADHVADEKHFQAVPIYWQQVQAAYRLQDWRAMATAENEFSRECLRLGWWEDAAYHAMVCTREEAIEAAGKNLMASRSAEGIRSALRKALPVSSLKRHAIQVARLIAATADGIPDDMLDETVKWLVRHTGAIADVTVSFVTGPFIKSIWLAVTEIAPRLDAPQAQIFADLACESSVFMGNNIHRQYLIQALNALCQNLPTKALVTLKNAAVPLIRERKNDIDYVDSINLITRIAQHGGTEIRDLIRQDVVPQGAQIKDAYLAQAAHYLGWTPEHPKSFSNGARSCAAAVRNQVQYLSPGEEPAKIGAIFTINHMSPKGPIAVNCAGAIANIQSLVPYRSIIDGSAMRELISAIIAMVIDQNNLIANRTDLVKVLARFTDALPTGMESEIIAMLEPLAAGQIVETEIGQTYEQSHNPMNPFKMGARNPVELRGAALTALAAIEKHHPQSTTSLHSGLLMQALTSSDAELRRQGLIAVESCVTLSQSETVAVALAALDTDDSVSAWALRALYGIGKQLQLDATTEQIIIRALESAIASKYPARRHNAAALLSIIQVEQLTPEVKKRMNDAEAAFWSDICYSVRSVLQKRPTQRRRDANGRARRGAPVRGEPRKHSRR